jgi:hypothetical protein
MLLFSSYGYEPSFGDQIGTVLPALAGIVVLLIIIGAVRSRKRNLVTLALSKYAFNPDAADFLVIEGRKTGLRQWILVLLKLGNRYQILVNKDQISYSEDSAKGNFLILTPLAKIASTGCGYSKPIGLLIAAVIFAILGIVLLFSVAQAGIVSILVAAVLVFLYAYKKKFFVNIQPISGAVFGFTFKRSFIENVAIDIELIKKSVEFLNEKVLAASK